MARKKAFIGAAISLGTSIVGGLMSSAAKRRQQEEQQRQQEAIYRAKEGSNRASSYNRQHANDYDLSLENERLYTSSLFKGGGSIHIKDSKKGTFTAAAKKRGQSVQGFASKVLANKDNYSPAMVKKAVFAHNAPKWKHRLGGVVNTLFRLGGGTKLKATKRATKQNLGLENTNKMGVNAPTAYRKPATESSQPSRTILSSEDKVVQKALESAISISPVKEIDDTRTTYKGGGKADVNNIITEGGDAKKIGHKTFLLRGRKHRNGGIVLGRGRNAIEAEGGEVVKIDKNTMKILSTVPMANGESPANRVLKGESPNKVFESQEQFKDRNNLNSKKYEYGGDNDSINNFRRLKPSIRSINSVPKKDRINTKVKTTDGLELDFDRINLKKVGSDSSSKYINSAVNDSNLHKYVDNNRETINRAYDFVDIFPKDGLDIRNYKSIKDVANLIYDTYPNKTKNVIGQYIKYKNYNNDNSLIKMNSIKKYKLGGSSLIGRRKAALEDYLNLAGDAFNMISPLIGGNRTKRAINRMVAPTQPTQLQAANLKTTYNIQPQLTDIYNAEQQSIAETNRNTASSVAAQARGTRLRQLGLNQRNQLRGQQQNIETQLINQNRLNRQQVTNQNIAATNDWRDRVSQFVNDQIVSKANVDNQMLESVSSGIRDLQSRSDKNQQERNALTAIMASNPEQVNLFMKKRKEYENLLDRNSRSLLRPYRCGGSVKRKMKR